MSVRADLRSEAARCLGGFVGRGEKRNCHRDTEGTEKREEGKKDPGSRSELAPAREGRLRRRPLQKKNARVFAWDRSDAEDHDFVDLTRAAARSPGLRRISRAASAVMSEVMCCSPMRE